LLFHTSLPIHEALDLRAGDVDLSAGLIYVSDALGTPKRVVELPDALREPLTRHVARVRRENGARSFDAPLFQANALRGRVTDEDDAGSDASAPPSEDEPSDRETRSLWGYATS
jgi:integrase